MKKIISIVILTFFTSCFSKETKDPEKAYEYWSGSKPPNEIELINGEYYQSPHFTLEYELFLEFKTNEKWFNEFIDYNDLEKDTIGNDWSAWTKLPKWFYTDSNFSKYSRNPNDEFEKSRYLYNPETEICFIYETVGM